MKRDFSKLAIGTVVYNASGKKGKISVPDEGDECDLYPVFVKWDRGGEDSFTTGGLFYKKSTPQRPELDLVWPKKRKFSFLSLPLGSKVETRDGSIGTIISHCNPVKRFPIVVTFEDGDFETYTKYGRYYVNEPDGFDLLRPGMEVSYVVAHYPDGDIEAFYQAEDKDICTDGTKIKIERHKVKLPWNV